MAVPRQNFHVPFVRMDLLPLWHERNDGKKPSKEAEKAESEGLLNRTTPMRAASLQDAIDRVEAMHPGCVAIREQIRRFR